jgi:GAF domain-containing protein
VSYPDHLWQTLAELSGFLLQEEDLDTTLRRVADLAVRTVAACDAVGVTLMEAAEPVTRAATSGVVYEVDTYQYDVREGPCLQAAMDSHVFEVGDMATEERWPVFCRHAAERGIGSSRSYPLMVGGEGIGALNLYARAAHAFGDADRELGGLFAAQAAVALANARTHSKFVRMTAELQEALISRAAIDQAKGILIAQNGCTAGEAFELLRAASQKSNRKLHVIAQQLVAKTTASRATQEDEGPDGTP